MSGASPPADGNGDGAWHAPLADDFAGPDFAPAGGLYYKRNAEQSTGRVRFRPQGGRDGGAALHLSVRPPVDTGTLDSERAEVWERPEVQAPYGTPLWYAFSLKLEEPIPIDEHRYLLAQWKRQILPGVSGNISPFLALRLSGGRLYVTVEAQLQPACLCRTGVRRGAGRTPQAADARADDGACPHGGTPAQHRAHERRTRALVATGPGPQPPDFKGCTPAIRVIARGGHLPAAGSDWIDFAFLARPGPQGDGHVEIVANGRWVATVRGCIGHTGPGFGARQYFKFGPYRAAHDGEWSVSYARFRRGLRYVEVSEPGHACSAPADAGTD